MIGIAVCTCNMCCAMWGSVAGARASEPATSDWGVGGACIALRTVLVSLVGEPPGRNPLVPLPPPPK